MSSRSLRVSYVAIMATLAIVAYFLIFAPWRAHGGESPEKTRVDFCGVFPLGTARERVVAFLLERHVRHSELIPSDRAVYAFLGNTCETIIIECSTEVKYTFTSDDHLVDCDVSQSLTGP